MRKGRNPNSRPIRTAFSGYFKSGCKPHRMFPDLPPCTLIKVAEFALRPASPLFNFPGDVEVPSSFLAGSIRRHVWMQDEFIRQASFVGLQAEAAEWGIAGVAFEQDAGFRGECLEQGEQLADVHGV